MDLHFEAIYENGVLRPLEPIDLADRSRVSVTVESAERGAAGLQACVGTLSPEAAAEMSAIVEREFERVDSRDW